MACACKKTINLESKLTNRRNKPPQEGARKMIDIVKDSIMQALIRVVICLLYLILTPVIIISLVFMYLFTGTLTIKIPEFITNKLKQSQNTESYA